jgi:hypothetical protein
MSRTQRIVQGRNLTTRSIAAFMAATVAAVLTTGSLARAQEEKLPKAEEILTKSIDAMGGKAAFEKLHNRVSKGTFEVLGQGQGPGAKGSATVYEAAPIKARTAIQIEGVGTIESGTDGKVFWELHPMMGARILDGEEKAMAMRQSTFNSTLHWKELYKKAECVGTEKVGDQSCYKLVMTPAEGSPESWYIDQKSSLPIRMDMVVKTQMGEMPIEVTIEDYKKVDGILYPHKATQKVMGVRQVITVQSIEHNVDIPKDKFDLPDPVKELLKKPASQPTKPAEPAKPTRP